MIAQIRATPIDTPGWFEPGLSNAWKNLFPITPISNRTGNLALDHPAWVQMPNPWWRFITDTALLSWEKVKTLSRQRRPSAMPHFDESGWIVQERRIMDFRGLASVHMGNHPMLKQIKILVPIKRCNMLLCCKEDTMGILKYMMVWKLD